MTISFVYSIIFRLILMDSIESLSIPPEGMKCYILRVYSVQVKLFGNIIRPEISGSYPESSVRMIFRAD